MGQKDMHFVVKYSDCTVFCVAPTKKLFQVSTTEGANADNSTENLYITHTMQDLDSKTLANKLCTFFFL